MLIGISTSILFVEISNVLVTLCTLFSERSLSSGNTRASRKMPRRVHARTSMATGADSSNGNRF